MYLILLSLLDAEFVLIISNKHVLIKKKNNTFYNIFSVIYSVSHIGMQSIGSHKRLNIYS